MYEILHLVGPAEIHPGIYFKITVLDCCSFDVLTAKRPPSARTVNYPTRSLALFALTYLYFDLSNPYTKGTGEEKGGTKM